MRRKELQTLLTHAAKGQFDVVVVCDTKRLSRRLVRFIRNPKYPASNERCSCFLHDDRQTAFLSEEGRLQEYSKNESNEK